MFNNFAPHKFNLPRNTLPAFAMKIEKTMLLIKQINNSFFSLFMIDKTIPAIKTNETLKCVVTAHYKSFRIWFFNMIDYGKIYSIIQKVLKPCLIPNSKIKMFCIFIDMKTINNWPIKILTITQISGNCIAD